MNQLLAIEWLKIKRYRTFWVLTGLFAILVPLLNYTVTSGMMKLGGNGKKDGGGMNILESGYSFPSLWANLGFWGSLMMIFAAVLVIILTTNEYTYRTNRQNVIDGWSRMQFFHSKVILVVVMSIVVTVFMLVLGLLFAAIGGGSIAGFTDGIERLGYFFVLSLDYMGLGLFIAVWIRRSGLAIGLFVLYSMIIELILEKTINHYGNTEIGKFLPLQASDELLPFPIIKMGKQLLQMSESVSMTTYMIVALGWCVLYYVGSYMLLKRSDW